jgi:CDP-glycerol glycerophosphotransferase (TagB/SpsB family)
MKIILIIPDGVVVRNYLYSNFMDELTQRGFEIYVFHQITNAAIVEIKLVTQNIKEFNFIPYFTEPTSARIIREVVVYARLLINKRKLKNESVLYFWNINQKGFKRKFLINLSEFFGFFVSKSYKLLLLLEKKYDNLMLKTNVAQELSKKVDQIQPDIVLNLHQRSMTSAPIINYSRSKGIKTATVIYSWDNVPKARLISTYDNYYVWSELMKNELDLLYPEINRNQIKVVGTPQFEFYFDKKLYQTKTEFFEKYNLVASKKTICFSSNDTSSPYEPNYLEDLCQEISKVDVALRPQILFRINPFDKSGRFNSILEKYKNLVFVVNPDWRTEIEGDDNFINIFPSYNDISLLVNTVLHSDVVVNLGSTMAHDFAVLNKPCLYFNYDPELNSKLPVKDVYQFQHFRSMNNLEAVGWINAKLEIVDKILKAIEEPNQTGKDRTKWMQLIVKHPLNENSKNLANELERTCTSV